MELPHIGTHCAEPTCRQFDFLPFTCNLCKKEFCLDHHKYEAHNCTESYQADAQVPICPLCDQPVPSKRGQPPDLAVNEHMENNCKHKKKKIYTNKCSAIGCKAKEMIPVSCDSCKQNFCLRHRHPTDHDCKGPRTAREQALAAATARATNNKRQSTGNSGKSSSSSSRSTQPGIQRYFSPSAGPPRPTGHSQPVHSPNLSTFQAGLTEEEALARAMAASVLEVNREQPVPQSGGGGGNPEQEDEDAQLARAIAASMEGHQRIGNNQQQNSSSNNCNVC